MSRKQVCLIKVTLEVTFHERCSWYDESITERLGDFTTVLVLINDEFHKFSMLLLL